MSRVPFIPDKHIKREADDLIRDCQLRFPDFQVPFSLDLLIYDYLNDIDGLSLDTETKLGDGGDSSIVGKTIPHKRLILIDPECVGKPYYRFTLAHEIGHWILHGRPLVGCSGQGSLFTDDDEDLEFVTMNRTVMSHPSALRDPEEIQANKFASNLLMPQQLVEQEFHFRFATEQVRRGADNDDVLRIAREYGSRALRDRPSLCQLFDVSRESMAYRLMDLRLIAQADVFAQ